MLWLWIVKANTKRYWQKKYGKLAAITIAAVYLLIIVGGVVRSTGSGMGCPDWPKCFGSWVPPTSAEQLPSDYKEVYSEKRGEKNKRFASLLEVFGADQLAYQLRHDESLLIEADFNPVKTWIEYFNRLVGVTIGFLIMATFAVSFSFRSSRPGIFWASLATFVLVVFQGWLGSIVVSTNLLPWMVTVHMLPALVIVALLVWAKFQVQEESPIELKKEHRQKLGALTLLLIGFSLVQIILGTQVRELVDEAAVRHQYTNREVWIEELGIMFYIHRSYSIVILLFHLLLFYLVRKFAPQAANLNKWSSILLAVLLLEITSGVIMAYFAIPAFLQPMHLFFGTVLFGVLFYILLLVNSRRVEKMEQTDLNSDVCLLQEAGK